MSPLFERHVNSPSSLPRGLGLSIVAHAAFLLIAIFVASKLVPLELPMIEPISFTLVRDEAKPADAVSSFSHAVSVDSVVKLPPIARPRPSIPVPEPTNTFEPSITDTAPTTKPVRVNNAPRMTIDDFRARHPQPSPKAIAKPGLPTPKIIMDRFDVSPSAAPSPHAEVLSDEVAARFTASLIQRLREAYTSPGQEGTGLSCRIEFTLRADGRVESSRILVSSGHRLLDDAVISALKRVKPQTPPSSFVGCPIITTFQIMPVR